MKYKIIDKWLTPNPYSRSQKPMKKIKGIAIHWVGNPKTTANANRNYFESLKDKKVYASAHEFIDLNGDVLRCVPSNEVAYAVGSKTYTKEAINNFGYEANYYTYSIECTHIDWDGRMTNETYNTLVNRCVDLCKQWNLNPLKDLWLHYEIVGWKDCHRWFVNNPNEWKKFKELVNSKININPKVVIGNKTFNGLLYEGKTIVPVRTISEELGFVVNYNSITKEVTVNNIKIDIINIDSISYAPLRYLFETLNYNVNWDNETKTATIY